MPKIFFSGNSGSYVTKKRKRMPGTDNTRKPEVKTWDPLNPDSNRDVYIEYNILNNTALESGEVLPARTQYSWTPIQLQMPNVGTGSTQRIGDRILWKYLKIKGYVEVCRNLQQPINWRLVLFRLDNDVLAPTVNRSFYLNHFKMVNTTSPTTFASSVIFCTKNYYLKIANPEDTFNFKRKIIASGSCPVTSNITSSEVVLKDQGSGYSAYPIFGNNLKANGGVGMYIPIDVTVNINDNIIYGNITYWLLLEVDCGHGWQHAENNGDVATGDARTLSLPYNPMFLNFICKGYFYDY